MTLDDDFEQFLDKLQLDRQQVERINSAEQTLSERLRKHFGLKAEDTFLQGSYANGSAIKPPPSATDGEYDIDLVVISAGPDEEPAQAMASMRNAVTTIGYGERIEEDGDRNRPCVRLRYAPDDAGHFHVDIVPARENSSGAPLEIPRPAEGQWKQTAPQEYAEWCTEQGDEFLRTVQQLKRWRDQHQNARQAIKSIVLQVLISNCMPHGVSDGQRIAATLRGIASLLTANPSGPPAVPNPVLPSENLTRTWPSDAYRNFIAVVGAAADLAEHALNETDEVASCRLWQQLFGEDFPGRQGGGTRQPPPPLIPAARKTRQGAPRSEWA
jgi:predicted nucleotidyltransferase